MRKWLTAVAPVIAATLIFIAGTLVSCSCEDNELSEIGTKSLHDVRITVNDACFYEEYGSGTSIKILDGLLLKLTLENQGDKTAYFYFSSIANNFYIQNKSGTVWDNIRVFYLDYFESENNIGSATGMMDLKLEPGESDRLVFYVHDIIEGSQEAEGLKLFCKDLETDERISISLEVRSKKNGLQSAEGASEDNYIQEEELEGEVYTVSNYPKNPKTPGEVVAACMFLSDAYIRGEANFDDFLRLFSEDVIEEYGEAWQESSASAEPLGIQEVQILNVEIYEEGKMAEIEFLMLLESGAKSDVITAELIYENGQWEIDNMEDR